MVENELQQAIVLIKAGNKSEAVPILKSILKTDRNNELVWLWLSACLDKTEDKIYCFLEALWINPENQNAQKVLNRLSPRVDEPTIEDMVPNGKPVPESPKQKGASSISVKPRLVAKTGAWRTLMYNNHDQRFLFPHCAACSVLLCAMPRFL